MSRGETSICMKILPLNSCLAGLSLRQGHDGTRAARSMMPLVATRLVKYNKLSPSIHPRRSLGRGATPYLRRVYARLSLRPFAPSEAALRRNNDAFATKRAQRGAKHCRSEVESTIGGAGRGRNDVGMMQAWNRIGASSDWNRSQLGLKPEPAPNRIEAGSDLNWG